MANNADLGITLQSLICKIYGLEVPDEARSQFEANYNPEYEKRLNELVPAIFDKLKLVPEKCLTYTKSLRQGETRNPHNFILSDGSTLSIRTNRKGDKVAPRVVGQCGLPVFNEFFSDMAGYEITDKKQIKDVVLTNIHLMLPVFLDYLFVSDYTIWVYETTDLKYQVELFDRSQTVDIDYDRSWFDFTRNTVEEWKESTTLKYRGMSLAEVQVHKNRTFKFRFIMSALTRLLVSQRITTETMGITAEKAICDIFCLSVPNTYFERFSAPLQRQMTPILKKAFENLPKPIESTGATPGERGAASKCSYDFLLEGNKTLSLKTNSGKMVCPPEVGQPGASTCYYYFKAFLEGNKVDERAFKKMVYAHIADIMPIYTAHLFDSDYLLWVRTHSGEFDYKIYEKSFACNVEWDPKRFTFTKATIEEWNESNTVKYDGLSIGEFQVHKSRECYKFRFNLDNLDLLIRKIDR